MSALIELLSALVLALLVDELAELAALPAQAVNAKVNATAKASVANGFMSFMVFICSCIRERVTRRWIRNVESIRETRTGRLNCSE